MVARMTLTHFVWVRILVPQPRGRVQPDLNSSFVFEAQEER